MWSSLHIFILMLAGSAVLAEALVLDYADFGPQVAAHRLLGPEWWQWETHGDSDPKTQYPLIPSENKDYRWIPLNQAIQYLDEEISKDTLERTTASLKKTRMQLINYFNVHAGMR